MQLTASFMELLAVFSTVFTSPTLLTFTEIASGWLLSSRHRYVTEVIFSGGNVGNGHWSRYHRFFSHASWDLDVFAMVLAKLVASILAPGAIMLWAVDDTLCRKRGLMLYGAGMHHDPLLSSKRHKVVNWGHDWVVLCLILVHPFWAPTKVFALPVAVRLYRNRQGVAKGRKGQAPAPKANHQTRPQLAVELIQLAATWFPNEEMVVLGDSAYGGKSVLRQLPANVHLISHVHPKGVLYEPAPVLEPGQKGRRRKRGQRLSSMAQWAADDGSWKKLVFNHFCFPPPLLP